MKNLSARIDDMCEKCLSVLPLQRTSLLEVSSKNHVEVVKFLVENGADVNRKCTGMFADQVCIVFR